MSKQKTNIKLYVILSILGGILLAGIALAGIMLLINLPLKPMSDDELERAGLDYMKAYCNSQDNGAAFCEDLYVEGGKKVNFEDIFWIANIRKADTGELYSGVSIGSNGSAPGIQVNPYIPAQLQ